MTDSPLERTFLYYWRILGDGTEPTEQYKFHPKRKWKMDFSWPNEKIAVEMQGMVGKSGKSGHTTWKGYANDCDKINAAQAMGWIVFQYTRDHTDNRDPSDMITQVLEALNSRRKQAS